jgi:hypothetical protein
MNDCRAPRYAGTEWIAAKLPPDVEPWPQEGEQFHVGPNDSDFEMTRNEAARYVSGKPWVWPSTPHFFLTDIHADANAFLASLVASGAVRRTGAGDADMELLDEGKEGRFVVGGDCFDKGPSNLRLLRAIGHFLRTGANVDLLAGNHDLRTAVGISFIGAKEPEYAHLFVRMGQKSLRLFDEVYREYVAGSGTTSSKSDDAMRDELFPDASWYEDFPKAVSGIIPEKKLAKELNRIREKTKEFEQRCAQIGLTLAMVHAAAIKCRELLLDPQGEFYWYFNRMKLAYRAGSFLFIHAGVDDVTAGVLRSEGVEGLNRRFQDMIRSDPFTLYHGPLGSSFRTKYRDIDFPFTDAGVSDVKSAGIYAIVHGHRNLSRGQRIMLRRGLMNFECDSSVDENTRKLIGLPGAGAAATILRPECRILAVSTDHPRVKVFDPVKLDDKIAILSLRSMTEAETRTIAQAIAG